MSSIVERRRVVIVDGLRVGDGAAVVIGRRVNLRAHPGRAAAEVLRGGVTLAEPRSAADLPAIAELAGGVVVGAAWTRDIPLVRAAAGLGLPVVVERGPSASLEEWLGLAGYCAAECDDQVILCETGRLDLGLLRAARAASGRPVLADVSGNAGLAAAAVAAGADGLIASSTSYGDTAPSSGDRTGGPASSGGGKGGVASMDGRESGLASSADRKGGVVDLGGLEGGVADGDELRVAEEAVTLVGALLRPEAPATLAECRQAIDRVDAALATLLESRAALAGTVQTLKPVGGFAGRDMAREREVVATMARRAPRLGQARLAPIMNAVIEAGLSLAEERRAQG